MKASPLANELPELAIERVDTLAGLEALRPAWDRLQDHLSEGHVLLDHRWVTAWWRHFGAGKELSVLVLRRGDEPVGIAPLLLSSGREAFPSRDAQFKLVDDYRHLKVPRWRRVVPVRRVTLPVNVACHNEHAHFLFPDDDPALYSAVFEYWRERRGEWDLLVLDGLPQDSEQPDRTREAALRAGLRVLRHGRSLALHRAVLGGSIDEFLATRSSHFRKRHRAELRRNAKAGRLDFREYRGTDIDRGMEVLFELERRSWKVQARDDREVVLPLDDSIRAFFSDAARSYAEDDRACVLVMDLDGEPAAALYGLTRGRERLTVVTYMDERVRGRVTSASLYRAFLERAIEDGMTAVDYNGCSVNVQKVSNAVTHYRRLYVHHTGAWSRLLGGTKAGATWLSRNLRSLRGEEVA